MSRRTTSPRTTRSPTSSSTRPRTSSTTASDARSGCPKHAARSGSSISSTGSARRSPTRARRTHASSRAREEPVRAPATGGRVRGEAAHLRGTRRPSRGGDDRRGSGERAERLEGDPDAVRANDQAALCATTRARYERRWSIAPVVRAGASDLPVRVCPPATTGGPVRKMDTPSSVRGHAVDERALLAGSRAQPDARRVSSSSSG